MSKFIASTFGRGLVIILPVTLTLYLLWWLGMSIESVLVKLFEAVHLPIYFPGMGVALVVVVVFVIGLIMGARVFRRLYGLVENQIEQLPLVGSLYGSFRDMMDFFSGEKADQMNQVVMVNLDDSANQRLMGFITRERFDDMPDGVTGESKDKHVAVYLPMSYQIGGFTIVVPRSRCTPVNMGIEQAMRWALTAGVTRDDKASDA